MKIEIEVREKAVGAEDVHGKGGKKGGRKRENKESEEEKRR